MENMGTLRVVFMGTPDFAVGSLRALAADPGIEIPAVYTQPDRPAGRGMDLKFSPVKQAALNLDVPSIRQPLKLSAPGEYEALAELRPDAIVVVAYGQILKRNILDLPSLGCINVHASILPRWRGAAPLQAALLAGDAESGVCTMQMVEKLDAGPVYLEKRTPIAPRETITTLHDRLSALGAELVLPTLRGLEAGVLKAMARVQDESRVTYAPKLTKDLEWLDLERLTVDEADRRIRALNPWPGTSVWLKTQAGKQRLKIREARPTRRSDFGAPGHGDRATADGKKKYISLVGGLPVLHLIDGGLELVRVQLEGKKEVSAADWVRGLRSSSSTAPGGAIELECE